MEASFFPAAGGCAVSCSNTPSACAVTDIGGCNRYRWHRLILLVASCVMAMGYKHGNIVVRHEDADRSHNAGACVGDRNGESYAFSGVMHTMGSCENRCVARGCIMGGCG